MGSRGAGRIWGEAGQRLYEAMVGWKVSSRGPFQHLGEGQRMSRRRSFQHLGEGQGRSAAGAAEHPSQAWDLKRGTASLSGSYTSLTEGRPEPLTALRGALSGPCGGQAAPVELPLGGWRSSGAGAGSAGPRLPGVHRQPRTSLRSPCACSGSEAARRRRSPSCRARMAPPVSPPPIPPLPAPAPSPPLPRPRLLKASSLPGHWEEEAWREEPQLRGGIASQPPPLPA